jgi:membrane protein implicated in regulation of membrane protease activity
MEYLIANPWIMWLAVGIFFLIVELLTTALVSIWFVPSAIITCLLSFVVDSLLLQTAIFVVLSAVFMVVCRKIYNKHIKKPVDEIDQNEKLLGKTATVTEDTNAITGRILVGDVYWRAVSESNEIIPKGETVKIKDVKGTTLVINKL